MLPLFVAYYTDRYAAEARGLIETLDAFGLEHDVRRVPCLGSWSANTSHKPAFLQAARADHLGRAICYVDADARIRRRPSLLGDLGLADIAVHYRGGAELLSGTVYLGASDAAGAILEEWRQQCLDCPGRWDQMCLADVLEAEAAARGWRIGRLPAAYCQIFDTMAGEGLPVIEHMQASRRLRFG